MERKKAEERDEKRANEKQDEDKAYVGIEEKEKRHNACWKALVSLLRDKLRVPLRPILWR